MKQFQKIAIGLLGFTNPEMFIPDRSAGTPSAKKAPTEQGPQPRASAPLKTREGRAARVLRALNFAFAALVIGSRSVPLADNSQLLRDLAGRAARLYGCATK
jgi:hypothetical protein